MTQVLEREEVIQKPPLADILSRAELPVSEAAGKLFEHYVAACKSVTNAPFDNTNINETFTWGRNSFRVIKTAREGGACESLSIFRKNRDGQSSRLLIRTGVEGYDGTDPDKSARIAYLNGSGVEHYDRAAMPLIVNELPHLPK